MLLALVLAAALQFQAAPAPAPASGPPTPAATWRDALGGLQVRRDELVASLATTHERLRSRVVAERPDLSSRIDPQPPAPRRAGLGVIPRIAADEAEGSVDLVRTWYSLPWLRERIDGAVSQAEQLRRDVAEAPKETLDAAVDRLAKCRSDLALTESQLSHHRLWQPDIHARAETYDALAPLARDLEQAKQALARGDVAASRELRARVASALAPLTVPAWVGIAKDEQGLPVATLRIVTDVTDAAFLEAFRDAVRRSWSESPGAGAHGFTLRIDLQAFTPDPPPPGRPSPGVEAHVAQFPPGSVVLTTGGDALHVAAGRALVLGPDPVAPRQLAHEVGHLLGFKDAYLRVYEGDLGSPDGITIVEWAGLTDDLMGSSSRGTVTPEMIGRFLAAAAGR